MSGNYSHARGVAYPIQIDKDTIYEDANFAQEAPHTDIFSVAPGVVITFVNCNLVNVTVPDGAQIHGGNLAQVVPTETGNKDRPTVNLLCVCEKCSPSPWGPPARGCRRGSERHRGP